jgi:hypothetical protein
MKAVRTRSDAIRAIGIEFLRNRNIATGSGHEASPSQVRTRSMHGTVKTPN